MKNIVTIFFSCSSASHPSLCYALWQWCFIFFLIVKWCTLSICSRIAQKMSKCWKEDQRWQKVTETKVKSCECCIKICFPISVCLLEQCGLFGQFNHSKHFYTTSNLLIHTDPYTGGGGMFCLLICSRKHSYTYTQTQMTTQPPSFPRPVYLWRKLGETQVTSSNWCCCFSIGVLQTILLPGEEYCLILVLQNIIKCALTCKGNFDIHNHLKNTLTKVQGEVTGRFSITN